MLQLLQRIENISSCRDREVLGLAIIAALHDLFHPNSLTFYRSVRQDNQRFLEKLAEHDGVRATYYGNEKHLSLLSLEEEPVVLEAWQQPGVVRRQTPSGDVFVFPLLVGDSSMPYGFFVLRFEQPPPPDIPESAQRFLQFYANYLGLLDYSELDSLTGLLNRKTFDEIFDKLLAKLPPDQVSENSDRREEAKDTSNWLAVIDIDHFKRVNDTFGHLFGDEVLLRLGNLMRATFRKHDYLFRFGGEEFIVVLRTNSPQSAEQAMERFRHAVETHEFPQVGRVTISAGYCRVNSSQAPTEVVGQADQALYYAKENGRNRVCCYQTLVEQRLIAAPEASSASVATDADIDELFG